MNRLTIGCAVTKTAETLREIAPDDARFEAGLIVARAAGIPHQTLAQNREKELTQGQGNALARLTAERLGGKPLQYVLGEWEFMGLPFQTDARALIPRQDTETLCEEALRLIEKKAYRTCLDLCCGTGCVGIALAKLAGVGVTLADCDAAALSLARENAKKNGVQAEFLLTDMFSNIRGRYDLVVCNPPYLTGEDMNSLQREVAFEPENALYGGEDGLDFYRVLARDAMEHIAPGGALLMEVGFGQARAVAAMFCATAIARDLNGIERVVTAYR